MSATITQGAAAALRMTDDDLTAAYCEAVGIDPADLDDGRRWNKFKHAREYLAFLSEAHSRPAKSRGSRTVATLPVRYGRT